MRTVSIRLVDLDRGSIPLGFAGENLHTQIRLDCKKAFEEYPNATVSLTVKNPHGDAYPVVTIREGDIVKWNVTNSDLAYDGEGQIQLSFSLGGVVKKSYVGKTKIDKSIIENGEIPDPIQDWIEEANGILAEIPDDISEALAAAKASGEFDGADGFSPTVATEEITGGNRVTITDAEGPHTFDVMDGDKGDPGDPGQPGSDGYSPTATVTKSGKVATITITDKNGTTTQTVSDGEAGDPTELIDDTAGSGVTNKVWSADKSSSLLTEINSKFDSLPTEETGQDLLEKEFYNTGLTDTVLMVLGMLFDNMPQDETATDILHSLDLECVRLNAIYELWLAEKESA